MHNARATTVHPGIGKGSWSEIFRNGLGLYSALVIGGIAMNATQMLVIAIIMPTIVRDIGGASFYTWAAMLYTIGSIVGGASTGMVWSRLGARRAYTLGAVVFAVGTLCCALAPDIGSLIAARGLQGWAGGLVSGSGMALITGVFESRLRTRIIAISQGTFTACHLSGPIVGGMFAAMQWWRLVLDDGGRFTFTFTPTHGSWLNLIEGFFSKLARSVLRHIRVSSKHELKERLMAFIDDINREPVVHTWRYKIDNAA